MKFIFITFLAISLIASCDNSSNTSSEDNSNTAVISSDQKEDTTIKVAENNTADVQEEIQIDKKEPSEEIAEVEKPSKKTVKKVSGAENYPDLSPTTKDFPVTYLMGQFDPKTHKDFTTIKTTHASRGGMYLRKDAYEAFVKMYDAAKKDGVNLKIISATRPFSHQKRIWEAKWFGQRKVDGRFLPGVVKDPNKRALLILRYSSMPGTSRHHWGTDIDLNDLNNSYFAKGTGKKIYDWLVVNASNYGYCQVYSPKGDERPWGYMEEKWHWSYLPVAKQLTKQYKSKITDADISGFEGAETAKEIEMVEKYVQGINKDCM